MPDPIIPDYRPPEDPRAAHRRRPHTGPDVLGVLSLVIFAGVLLCFLGGLAGLYFDPGAKEEWGGIGYIFLMLLPVMFVCPLGLLLGLVGMLGKPAYLSKVGVFCNGAALAMLLLWRLA